MRPAARPEARTAMTTRAQGAVPETAVHGTPGVAKGFSGPVTALDGLTVAVAPGITGLVGANGAGKSTLIKILLGLLEPTTGRATVLGHDCQLHGERIRTLIGYMPEHDCLPPDMIAAEFVTHMARISGLPKAMARERASETLRHVGLYEERYRRIGGYSTGMKQRVKLAQALVHDPELLLLDEPTNGLDPAGRRAMLDLVHRIGTEFGISVVVCSHLLGEIERICTSLVAIDAGRLLRSATLDSMTQARDLLMVEVDENAEGLTAALAQQGLEVRQDKRVLLVRMDSADSTEDVYDRIRDTIADLDLSLHRLERQRHQVADLFRDQP